MIRKMKVSDIPAVLALENKAFKTPWTEDQFRYELLDNPYAVLWVYEEEGKIRGYYDLWIIFENAELATIGVDPAYQKQGIGQKLMDHLTAEAMKHECENIGLEVRVSNLPAIKLYERNGFFTINVRPGYYKDQDGHEDAYRMMKGI